MVSDQLIQTDEQRPIQAELEVLEAVTKLMEHSPIDTRRRIMAYLNSRYPFMASVYFARNSR